MTILAGYAHTPEGEAALDHAIALAQKDGLELTVFDLDSTTSDADRKFTPPTESAPARKLVESGIFHRWLARSERSDDAPDELLDSAQEHAASLIVIGIRSRSRVGKFFLGSNAQRIILGSHVPVLAVKAAHHES
ncbi:nucleotide-binding universal stress UspA family protein [Arthrobacter sp. CAN_A6]|uniref:universal stress protein n=1 Tax=Arthrobacter sp. CAN_A6 TaxID=2787721 RepID=UPI0018C950C9